MPAPRTLVLFGVTTLAALSFGFAASPTQAAAPPPDLATAATFAVLAASTVTNTGPSTVSGDLGVSPGTAVTGFGPGTVTAGTIHSADAVALAAQNDLTTAYNTAAGLPPTAQVTADLGGQHLVPGVYTGPTLSLTGALTLDAGGDPAAVFVFQAGSTLITSSASSVLLVGGANPCNVFWQVGSSATLGTGSSFAGSVLALASVSATTGVTVHGRLLARTGAVTLDSDVITRPVCAAAVAGATPVPTTSPTSTTPTSSPTATPSASASAPASPSTSPATPRATPTASRSTPRPSSPVSTPTPTIATAPIVGPTVPTRRTAAPSSPTDASTAAGSTAGSDTVPGPVVSRRSSTPQLPQTGFRLRELLRIALVLMTLGGLALIGAATPRRCRPRRS